MAINSWSRSIPGLSASPSFSDFGMGMSPAEAEADSRTMQHPPPRVCTSVPASPMAFNGRPPAPTPRLSLDSLRAKGLWSTLAGARQACADSASSMRIATTLLTLRLPALLTQTRACAGEKSLPVAVPAPNKDKSTAAANRRRREKTIDGLDMYTWSELVRSSSL